MSHLILSRELVQATARALNVAAAQIEHLTGANEPDEAHELHEDLTAAAHQLYDLLVSKTDPLSAALEALPDKTADRDELTTQAASLQSALERVEARILSLPAPASLQALASNLRDTAARVKDQLHHLTGDKA